MPVVEDRARRRVFTRSISARLIERFIFNFRLEPSSLAGFLPVGWLKPQIINGWSVVSFCILRLERLMLNPLPARAGLETICCAYRCGVIDSTAGNSPSVYILGRNTDRRLISLMAPAIFESQMPLVEASIEHGKGHCEIIVRRADGRALFFAKVFPSKKKRDLASRAFDSLLDYENFIKDGVSSYSRSTEPGRYSRIDLRKDDRGYEFVDASVEFSQLDFEWRGSGLEYDSAVRTGGGALYNWTFRGLVPAILSANSADMITA